MVLLSAFLLALFVTMALVPALGGVARRLRIVDLPDERKVHTRPIPRIGGLAMALGTLVPAMLWPDLTLFSRSVLVGSAVIVAFGFLDDALNLSYKVKFAGQLGAALIVVLYGDVQIRSLGALLPADVLLPGWIAVPLTVVAIVGVTNALNLSDGLDGLAGGISVLGFCCIGYLGYVAGNPVVPLLAAAAVGSIFGFLRYNTHPATVFMGDAGSQFLGFLAATLALAISQEPYPLSRVVPLLLLGYPVLDTLTVMAVRVARGRSPFSPDKNHIHHRLLRLNFSHADSVLFIYAVQGLLTLLALALRFASEVWVLSVYVALSLFLLFGLRQADVRGWRLREDGVVRQAVVGRLKSLRRGPFIIQVSFRAVATILPVVLLFSCLLPSSIPQTYAVVSVLLAVGVLVISTLRQKASAQVLRVAVFFLVPVLVYLGDTARAEWIEPGLARLYHGVFGLLVLLLILVMKFSRRQAFHGTTMDFLILLIALVVPALPNVSHEMGLIASKIIVLFYGYDVLMAELRGRLSWVRLTTVAALALTAARGLLA